MSTKPARTPTVESRRMPDGKEVRLIRVNLGLVPMPVAQHKGGPKPFGPLILSLEAADQLIAELSQAVAIARGDLAASAGRH